MEYITSEFLMSIGFVASPTPNLYVLRKMPRIGYFVDSHEMIIGYASIGNIVVEVRQMIMLLTALKLIDE